MQNKTAESRTENATVGGADAACRAAELVERLNHRRNARRIGVGKPEVVVRAEVERPLLAAAQTVDTDGTREKGRRKGTSSDMDGENQGENKDQQSELKNSRRDR